MDNKKFAFTKTNYILVAIGVAVIILGFVLMAGPGCTNDVFEPDIFSVRRIKIAPVTSLLGFLTIIAAIAYKPKADKQDKEVKE